MQTLTRATVLSLMIATTPVWAQDAATGSNTDTAAPAAQAPAQTAAPDAAAPDAAAGADTAAGAQQPASPDDGLAMGTPEGQQAGTAEGQPYVKETHGDWELRCAKVGADKPEQCQLYQLLNDEGGNAVAEINLFALPPGGKAQAGANVITPLETLLTEQLTLSVDGGQGKRYPYTFCTRIGCIARIGFTPADVNVFKAGNAAQLTLVPAGAPDQKVNLKVSLSGFTAGFAALEKVAAAAN